MIVVNLFAGPGSGKSTTAAFLFYYLKSKNCNVELIQEYAKSQVYEGSYHKLNNQVYITAKQYKKLKDIATNSKENVQLVITDSPLLLGRIYCKSKSYYNEYSALLNVLNAEFDNVNVFVKRVKPYNPFGRLQTVEESDEISGTLLTTMNFHHVINGDTEGQTKLAEMIYENFKHLITI